MPKILDCNKNHLTIMNDDGKIEMVANDEYYHLKYDTANLDKRDEDNRIFHYYTKTQKIQETYNDKIFNLMFSGVILQSRQEEANRICQFINDNDCSSYMKYCGDKYQVLNCKDLIRKLLFVYADRLKFRKKGIVVDDNFMVCYDGSAMYMYGRHWHSLCLVVDGYIRDKLIDTAVGVIRMSRLLQTIMGKIGFCLKPNIRDSVFMNQLPNNLKRCVIDDVKQKDKELRKKQKEEEERVSQTRLDNERFYGVKFPKDDEMYGI